MADHQIDRLDDLTAARAESGEPYHEFLRAPSMSAGLYELRVGAEDRQRPHAEDEIYYVIEGRARFRAADQVSTVGRGDVLYVRAGIPHRFEEITENLRVLVVFSASS